MFIWAFKVLSSYFMFLCVFFRLLGVYVYIYIYFFFFLMEIF